MSTQEIRKPYADIVAILEANKDKKISVILPQIITMCESKKKDSTVRKDANGKVIEIFCYYHEQWEPVAWYGEKASSHSGFNTMCKIGVNEWTRRQSNIKKSKEEVLTKVSKGELKPEQIQAELEKIEKNAKKIIPREDSLKALQKKAADKIASEKKEETKK